MQTRTTLGAKITRNANEDDPADAPKIINKYAGRPAFYMSGVQILTCPAYKISCCSQSLCKSQCSRTGVVVLFLVMSHNQQIKIILILNIGRSDSRRNLEKNMYLLFF